VVDALDDGHGPADGQQPQHRLEQPPVEQQRGDQQDRPLAPLEDPDVAGEVDRLGLGAHVAGDLRGHERDDRPREQPRLVARYQAMPPRMAPSEIRSLTES
jgi:hypothetical protein